ncbi:hydantoinase/oxoprolinase family protein [Endozoicomonas sp. SM1973]|uniref:Hydantoinase/oxoprolinase family protein n=1 Tax=Spartinivicinus marinus TaxID=2994442 RepID=A0A853IEN0_9GAMM|nr:hydantoinase/oxoprolinase family protein [Spartinivicinus marinus]MCX4027283.1 hydantoinase/oxoprolinase family protein [Spartinivicinus marinus]NYZ67957.1 hydantoinase/oxoprolinase family protein [Spartinivicinus marinus]
MTHPLHLLGVDTGGTFTDFVYLQTVPLSTTSAATGDQVTAEVVIHKVLSTPQAPAQAIWQGISEMGLQPLIEAGSLLLIHGSTVATNAALEGKGVKTLYVTNEGFADVLTIGRQQRQELYNFQPDPIKPPVPKALCIEVGCRLDAKGNNILPLTGIDIYKLQQAVAEHQPAAVAINLLFSFLNDADEKALEAAVSDRTFTSRSSFVLPEYREYERGMATWLNAWLGPIVASYLNELCRVTAPCPVAVMQSSGGTTAAEQASNRAVNLLLSGPAGGLSAASFIGNLIGQSKLITFDMGGTSTDVALIDGRFKLTNEGKIANYPVAVPMVDMHTIGAGGGSIAYLDSGGMLQVGPVSAGAEPGPACYGLGGYSPTVTDANLVLGHLPSATLLGGSLKLDIKAAKQTVADLGETVGLVTEEMAKGIIQLANEHMVNAIRVISIQKGYDPQEFTLCCFGGAGGQHVCAVADALGMAQAIVPVNSGVLSALGMLAAPRSRQLVHTYQKPFSQLIESELHQAFCHLKHNGVAELAAEGLAEAELTVDAEVDVRYLGQSFTLTVPCDWQQPDLRAMQEAFHLAHQAHYGHRMESGVELVNLRLALKAPQLAIELPEIECQPLTEVDCCHVHGVSSKVPIYQRAELGRGIIIQGPAIVCEQVATTYLAPGWQAEVDRFGNLQLNRQNN